MTEWSDQKQKILDLAQLSGMVSASEVRSLGIHTEYLRRLCIEGKLVRIARGLYELTDGNFTGHHGLAVAARAVPHGVVCLLSALRFHENRNRGTSFRMDSVSYHTEFSRPDHSDVPERNRCG